MLWRRDRVRSPDSGHWREFEVQAGLKESNGLFAKGKQESSEIFNSERQESEKVPISGERRC